MKNSKKQENMKLNCVNSMKIMRLTFAPSTNVIFLVYMYEMEPFGLFTHKHGKTMVLKQ